VGFPEKIFPIEENLKLKIGAQVMFVKNDTSIDKIISMGRWELSSRCLARKFLFIFRRQND
jgi:hypothetical protein